MRRTDTTFPARGRRAGLVSARHAGGWTRPIARLCAALGLASAAFAATAMEPADTSTMRASDGGAFVVSVSERPEPVPLNALHAWTLHVETADGEPVDDAVIGVGGGMPMHDHGLPTAPRVSAAPAAGDYVLEGLKFQMPGHWVVELAIEAGDVSDTVTFELML